MANAASCSLWLLKKGSLPITSPPGRSWARWIKVAHSARMQHMELQRELPCRRLQVCRYGLPYWAGGRVDEQCNAGRRGHQLMQELHPLRPYLCSQRRYAREIAARSSETGDKSRRGWVVAGREDDRNGRRRRLC